MARNKHEEEEHADETWLVPYSDVLTLLLALFIVLFAMSKIDESKFRGLADSLHNILSGTSSIMPGGISFMDTSPVPSPRSDSNRQDTAVRNREETIERMNAAINAFIEAHQLQEMVLVVPTATGFTVRIIDSVLFDTGSYVLKEDMLPLLRRIAEVAANADYYMLVEGHTDDAAYGAMGNWDLSSNRAMAVLKYLVQQGVDPEKLSATGFGPYHPLYPNITERNMAMNRRVEINFVTPEYYMEGRSRQ